MEKCEHCDKPPLPDSRFCEEHQEAEPVVEPTPPPRQLFTTPRLIVILGVLAVLWAIPKLKERYWDEPPAKPSATAQPAKRSEGGAAATPTANEVAAGAGTDAKAGPAVCGNGIVDPGEQCDGNALGDATCASLGFSGDCTQTANCVKAGLTCLPTCKLDYSGCTTETQTATQRFVRQTSSTAIDRLSGLVWEMKCAELDCPDRHNVLATFAWKAAATDWIKSLNDEKFGGFSDWRLPSLEELRSLLMAMPPCTGEPCSGGVWPRKQTAAAGYWTSTTFSIDQQRAWAVSFRDGNVYTAEKPTALHVRAVRKGP